MYLFELFILPFCPKYFPANSNRKKIESSTRYSADGPQKYSDPHISTCVFLRYKIANSFKEYDTK